LGKLRNVKRSVENEIFLDPANNIFRSMNTEEEWEFGLVHKDRDIFYGLGMPFYV
jgi:hypothetical protein